MRWAFASWADRIAAANGALLPLALFPFAAASAECIDVVDVRTELPHEVTTPNRIRLSYFYNLETETYFVLVAAGETEGAPYGPFMLTRGCVPAMLRWESDEFVLLEAGCGTFCWSILALPVSAETAGSREILRPLIFDAGRNLVLSYPDQDTIGITSLATGYEQTVRTARRCESSAEICFDARLDGDELVYAWRHEPMDVFTVALDEALRSR